MNKANSFKRKKNFELLIKNFLFRFEENENKEDCYVTRVSLIRNRFNLKDENDEDKKNSLAFQNEFVSLMQKIESNLTFLDVAYFGSHLKEQVTIEYSLSDLKFVALAFFSFWAIFTVQMLFDLRNFFFCLTKKKNLEENASEERKSESYLHSKFFGARSIFRDGSLLIVIAVFVQFALTMLATAGLISIFSIELNQLLVYYPFIFMSKF